MERILGKGMMLISQGLKGEEDMLSLLIIIYSKKDYIPFSIIRLPLKWKRKVGLQGHLKVGSTAMHTWAEYDSER